MTDMPSGLVEYRNQLREGIARDLRDSSRAHRRVVRLGAPLAGAAAAGVAAVALSGGAPVQSADAAILRHVRTALTAPANAILHERALVTLGSRTSPYELWESTDAPHSYRVVKFGQEATGRDGSGEDLAATLRSMVDAGKAHVTQTTTYDGAPAYKLTVTGADRPFLNGTVYVSSTDYHPLLIDSSAYGGERIAFQTYEYLPKTAANERLASGAPSDSQRLRRK